MPIGEEPVGRPSTKGCDDVGANALILSRTSVTICCACVTGETKLTDNVIGNIL